MLICLATGTSHKLCSGHEGGECKGVLFTEGQHGKGEAENALKKEFPGAHEWFKADAGEHCDGATVKVFSNLDLHEACKPICDDWIKKAAAANLCPDLHLLLENNKEPAGEDYDAAHTDMGSEQGISDKESDSESDAASESGQGAESEPEATTAKGAAAGAAPPPPEEEQQAAANQDSADEPKQETARAEQGATGEAGVINKKDGQQTAEQKEPEWEKFNEEEKQPPKDGEQSAEQKEPEWEKFDEGEKQKPKDGKQSAEEKEKRQTHPKGTGETEDRDF